MAKDPSVLLNISNVQLIVDNEVYMTLPITVVNRELGIYSGGPVLFPDTSFKIRVGTWISRVICIMNNRIILTSNDN